MLRTKYEIGELPHSEYPRPQMRRDSFLCLNGEWSFAKCKRDESPDTLPLSITVPFSPESLLSGVGNTDFMNAVWYARAIEIPRLSLPYELF